MYLEKAKNLLAREYNLNYELGDEAAKYLMNEKIRHSYQVLGMGNFLLKHENAFEKCDAVQIDKLKATVLLHDIGRFYESVKGQQGIRVDHGEYGAELLSKENDFNDVFVTLPIKHHGHLIERLFEDMAYQSLSEHDKAEIHKIIYLVRDADKLANFYLLTRDFEYMETLFVPEITQDNGLNKTPSEKVETQFMACQSVNYAYLQNAADRVLMIMGCVYDLGYKSSFEIMAKLGMIDKLWGYFAKFFYEKDLLRYKEKLNRFLKSK